MIIQSYSKLMPDGMKLSNNIWEMTSEEEDHNKSFLDLVDLGIKHFQDLFKA